MDRELAGIYIQKWEDGQPISEVNLYKAASVLGIDPDAALVEARFISYLDNCLSEKRAMSLAERIVFSAGASLDSGIMTKTASAYGFSPDELIVEALRERNFVPDVIKIANLSAAGGDPTMMDPATAAMQQQAGEAMMAPPQQGAMLQQQPQARFKPSPTAPEQAPPSPMGNLEELIGQGQQIYGDQAMQNGGTAPAGMPQPAPPPPSPEERIQQVGPNLDPDTVARYAEQLTRFEEGFQMPINDPKQMVKFVKELQKVDGKKVDQGIKAMGQQLEQEQAQELGVDATPTIDGPGGAGGPGGQPGMSMAPKPGGASGGAMPGAEGEGAVPGGPPKPSQVPDESGSQPGAGATQSSQGGDQASIQSQPGAKQQPPRPPQKPAPQQAQQAAQDAAVEKVANVARALARASARANQS